MTVLSLFDITGIQAFVFGSRRLRDVMGASFLVHQILQRDRGPLVDAVRAAGGTPLWAGGGNAMVESPSLAVARSIATSLSLWVLEHAPGLGLACVHRESVPGESWDTVSRALHDLMKVAKAGRLPDVAPDDGGVTALCVETGAPAVRIRCKEAVGRSIMASAGAHEAARERLRSFFPLTEHQLDWTDDLDAMGRTEGEESAFAVVHMDGNGMGERIKLAGKCGLEDVKDLSLAVDRAGEDTFRDTLEWVVQDLVRDQDGSRWYGKPKAGGFRLQKKRKTEDDEADVWYFPVRPILYGGDDITLICDARFALDLAAFAMAAWHRRTAALPHGGACHSCAGVAIVGPHTPFARAAHLAERLCLEAKASLNKGENASLLHWTLSRSGAEVDSVPAQTPEGASLTCRPYFVLGARDESPWRNWTWFRATLLPTMIGKGGQSTTQLKALAEALRDGTARRLLRRWKDRDDLQLAHPNGHPSLSSEGFIGNETPYLDALEVFDLVALRSTP